jgi:hypothetical protein
MKSNSEAQVKSNIAKRLQSDISCNFAPFAPRTPAGRVGTNPPVTATDRWDGRSKNGNPAYEAAGDLLASFTGILPELSMITYINSMEETNNIVVTDLQRSYRNGSRKRHLHRSVSTPFRTRHRLLLLPEMRSATIAKPWGEDWRRRR